MSRDAIYVTNLRAMCEVDKSYRSRISATTMLHWLLA